MISRMKTLFSILVIMAVLMGSGLPIGAEPAAAADDDPKITIESFKPPIKGNPKLDSQLNRLVSANATMAPTLLEKSGDVSAEMARVVIECLPGKVDAVEMAVGANATIETSYENMLQATVPIAWLTTLAALSDVRLVRLPQHPVINTVTSEGVGLINADDWQAAGYNGAGVKIGILDGGFANYALRQSQGEVPAAVDASWSSSIGQGSSTHGTACTEIIYDVAPGAQFYLASFASEVEFGDAVTWMITQGVKVISCSMAWPGYGPGDGSGIICNIVANARSANILWSQSAGNYAQMHWQGNFIDTVNPSFGWHEFVPGGDETNTLSVSNGQIITARLNWDDTWGASANDYDLYLLDNSLSVIWGSENVQDGNDNPFEFFSYAATYTGVYHIAVKKYDATRAVNFHLFSTNHNLEYQTTSSSLSVPADSANAMTIGAVPWNNPTTIEVFSSQGPTKDGRIKPDLTAPDGVSNATLNPFYGTSASAPHAAAAAALVKQRYPAYTPDQIQAFLEGRAVPLGAAGKDNIYGSGRLDMGAVPALTAPTATTNAATVVTPSSAVLNGSLTLGDYSSANISFMWGTTSDTLSETPFQLKNQPGVFSADLTGLLPSTTYYFKAKAASGSVTVYGSTANFTTLKELTSIAITPFNPTIAKGRGQQFSATGTFTDSSTANITTSATWTSSNTAVCTIGLHTGLAQSLAEGSANITSVSGSISSVTLITVGPKALDSLVITPDNPSIALGRNQEFTVTGTYSDSSTEILTGSAAWSSSNPAVASITRISSDITDFAMASDGTTIYAVDAVGNKLYKSTDGGVTWTIPAAAGYTGASMDMVAVAPGGSNLIAIVDKSPAGDRVFLSTNGGASFGDTGTLNPAMVINDIAISPLSEPYRYIAAGGNIIAPAENSDGAALYVWNYGATVPMWKNIFAGEGFTALTPWTALAGDYEDIEAVAFSPSFAIDQAILFITETIGGTGDGAIGLHVGSFNTRNFDAAVDATFPRVLESATAATLTCSRADITLAPDFNLLNADTQAAFFGASITGGAGQIGGIYSDNYTLGGGVYTLKQIMQNTAVYSVAYDGTNLMAGSNNTNLVYRSANPLAETPVFASSAINPASINKVIVAFSGANVLAGTSGPGSYFAKSSNLGATFTYSGLAEYALAQSLAVGQTTITAQYGSVSDTTTLTVTAKVLDSIYITPNGGIVAVPIHKGNTIQLTATGTYSDSSTEDITTSVTWTSSNTTICTVGLYTGLVYGVNLGTANVTAQQGSINAFVRIGVNDAVLESIVIVPDNPTFSKYSTKQFTAIGTYSDNTTGDITDIVTWTSSNTTVCVIGIHTGQAVTQDEGETTITAEHLGISDTTLLTVVPKVLDNLAIVPDNPKVPVGRTQPFRVTGTYADNVTADLTPFVTWSSSNTTAAEMVHIDRDVSDFVVAGDGVTVYVVDKEANKIYKSTNAGASWTELSRPAGMDEPGLIAVASDNVNIIAIVDQSPASDLVFLSGDGGESFTSLGTPATNMTINDIAISMLSGPNRYIAVGGNTIAPVEDSDGAALYVWNLGATTPEWYEIINGGGTPAWTALAGIYDDVETVAFSASFVSDQAILFVTETIGGAGDGAITLHVGSFNNRKFDAQLDNTFPRILETSTASALTCNRADIALAPDFYLSDEASQKGFIGASLTGAAGQIGGIYSFTYTNAGDVYTLKQIKENVAIGSVAFNGTNLVAGAYDANFVYRSANPLAPIPVVISVPFGPDGIDKVIVAFSNAGVLAGVSGANSFFAVSSDDGATFTYISLLENGFAQTLAEGQTIITAQYDAISDTTILTVSNNVTLTMAFSGNGNITPSAGSHIYSVGESVDISAAPAARWAFVNWTGDVANTASAATNVTMDQDKTVTANFVRTHGALTLTANGSGTVSMSPAAANNTYPVGMSVNITAAPAIGWQFVSWTGDVSTVPNANAASTNVTINSDYTITANFSQTPAVGGGGGGGVGGGGGSGATNEKRIFGLGGIITDSGEMLDDIEILSIDIKLSMNLTRGTIAKNSSGWGLSIITVTTIMEPDAAPAGNLIIGGVYDLSPSGATFAPPLPLIMHYDESAIPEGVDEENLYLATWDESLRTWVRVDCQVDIKNNQILAFISHFSRYTILADTRNANFTISDISVNPAQINTGESVTVSVKVANTGNITGDHQAVLKLNGAAQETKSVSLSPNTNTMVSFNLKGGESGTYSVDIETLHASFTVTGMPAKFEVKGLSISPAEINPGEFTVISITVTNNGESEGKYLLNLKINTSIVETREIEITGKASQEVMLKVKSDAPGKNIVEIDGLTGSFIVRGEAAPPAQIPLPAATAANAATTEMTSAPDTSAPAITTEPDKETKSKLWIYGVLGGGILLIAACVLIIIWRRRRD